MRASKLGLVFAGLFLLMLLGAGCESENPIGTENQEPNTRISLAPPEGSDASYSVDIFWFGFDDDGEISHYEIAWETEENWIGPIFGTDSTFVLSAADSCCGEPLPEFGSDIRDSVYQQFHTFYVRAVDDQGAEDKTPAFRTFNAKTIAPYTKINFGPVNSQDWGTDVIFKWDGFDDDGVVVSYEYVLTSRVDYRNDHDGVEPSSLVELVAWADTLTFRPLPGGGYSDERVWKPTLADSTLIPGVQPIPGSSYIFIVRAIDNAGAKERGLAAGDNYRSFNVVANLDGPRLTLISNVLGLWTVDDAPRDVFQGQGIRFRWIGRPSSTSLAPIAGYSYAVEDTSQWSAFSLNTLEWPEQIEGEDPQLWFPEPGPHKFFLRAIDFAGFGRVLPASINVLGGPRQADPGQLYVLAVLDTDGNAYLSTFLPTAYTLLERALIEYFLEGYNFQIFQTGGTSVVPASLFNLASSTIWIMTSEVESFDSAILKSYHSDRSVTNILPSYVRSGGNLLLCGIRPVNAMRYFDNPDEPSPIFQELFPIDFRRTTTDTTYVPHWAYTELGISRIENSLSGDDSSPVVRHLVSQVTTGNNPYPDIRFDPLSITQGPIFRGFKHYDTGIIPADARTEVIYRDADTGQSLAVRRLTSPGIEGNLVYLGFHPYYLQKNEFRNFLRAVLTDFGESRQ